MKAIHLTNDEGSKPTALVALGVLQNGQADALVAALNAELDANGVTYASNPAGIEGSTNVRIGAVLCDSTVDVGDAMVLNGIYVEAP